ncbi:hypothetical protein [Nibricoccus aquaticus]|uniref:hypothetical protein n=1 Tax=Nibricoccus aquaticus TaxID=2576891 RepID=UPI0010FD53C6|nr:hypothetical protein [Nibricoccus aquaticus]
MRQRILCILDERRAHLKREWARRLRLEPVRSALGEPAVLVYMMDETLRQLSGLIARQHAARRAAPGDFESRCGCRLNPLLAYFSTGEASLLMLLEEAEMMDEPVRALVSGWWRVLAQGEIDAVCGLCVRTCHAPYPKIPAALRRPEPADAGGRGTR